MKRFIFQSLIYVSLIPVFAIAQSIEEVVVTAQKREQSLQDVAIAVTAFTGDQLQDRGLDSVTQLEDITPNLRIRRNFGDGVPNFAIRGVGHLTDLSTVSSSPVAVHINEVPHPYPVTSTNLMFDLERVEVLRGPQGDLFGLNTTGGTINFITAKPTDEFEASIMAEYGRWDRYKVEGFISGPLSDNLRGRMAVSRNERTDGWQTNDITGEKLGEFEKTGVRGTIDFDLTETFNALLEVHYTRDDSDAHGARLLTVTAGTRDLDPTFTDFLTFGQPVSEHKDTRWSDTSTFFSAGTKPFIDHEGVGGSLILTWDTGPVTVTSVSGYENFDRFEFLDHDADVRLLSDEIFRSDIEGWSTELRMASNNDGPLTWLVGFNYADDEVEQLTIFDIVDEIILGFPGVGGQNPIQERNMWSIFGHGEWEIAPSWKLSAGIRWTDEERKQTRQGTFKFGDNTDLVTLLSGGAFLSPGPSPFDRGVTLTDADFSCFAILAPCVPGPAGGFTETISSEDWSGKITLDYLPNDNWLLYASIARGIKSGGFGDNAASISATLVPYDQEELLAYEIGAKGTILDNTLRLNVAAFYYDYEDQQISDFLPDPIFGPLISQVNAPETEIYGFELEALWAPSERWTISQNLGYTKGEFEEFTAVNDTIVNQELLSPTFTGTFSSAILVDRSGTDIGFPEWQYSGLVSYEFPVNSFGSGLFGRIALDYSYESETKEFNKFFTGHVFGEQIPTDIDSHWIVNARVSLIQEDKWELTVFGTNILNEKYDTYRDFFDSATVASVGLPATWGVRFKYNFY